MDTNKYKKTQLIFVLIVGFFSYATQFIKIKNIDNLLYVVHPSICIKAFELNPSQ